MIQTKSIPILPAILAMVFAPFPAFSQDEDLTLPGDPEPVVVNTGSDESASESGASKKKETLIDMVLDGGWAMIPLFAMLFAAIGLSVYLLLDLKKGTFVPKPLSESLQASAQVGDLNGISENSRSSPSCLGQVMNGACEYIYDRGYHVLDGDSLFDQMAEATQEFNRKRISLLNYLSVIFQAAPMVGLLGTVSGMIKAFATLQQSGMGDPGELAGNISEALVTTASGLIVALPTIFAYFHFRDKMVARVAEVDKQCSIILNHLRRAVIGRNAPALSQGPPPQQQAAPAQQQAAPAQQQQPVQPHPPQQSTDVTPHPPQQSRDVTPHPPQQPPNNIDPHPPQS